MTKEVDTIKIIADRALLVRANSQNDAWPVPSPCVAVCKMDEAREFCLGCFRTIDELRQWGHADAAFKRMVWARIEARMAAAQA